MYMYSVHVYTYNSQTETPNLYYRKWKEALEIVHVLP